jgi:PAS domain S-box-containing protein
LKCEPSKIGVNRKSQNRYTVAMKHTKPVANYMNLLAAMERALKTANIPIIITEATLKQPGPRILFVNRAFCASTGYSEKELVGKTPRILQGPRTNRLLLQKLAERLKNGEPFIGQTINYRKDGVPYLATWNISPICDDNGKITHYVSFQLHSQAPRE